MKPQRSKNYDADPTQITNECFNQRNFMIFKFKSSIILCTRVAGSLSPSSNFNLLFSLRLVILNSGCTLVYPGGNYKT